MNLAELIAKFAEEAKIDAKLAKRIIDKLAENELSVEKMNSVIRRLRDWFVKNEYWSFLQKLKDDTVQKVIDEMIADEMKRAREDQVASCSELSVRAFHEFNEEWKEYKAGDEVKIQIMRTGERDHPAYWKVKVTKDTLKDVLKNFNSRARWIDLAVDENHEPNHRAFARFKKLYMEWQEALYGVVKLTQQGAEALTKWYYKYFSPEIIFQKKDEESWKIVKNLLLWGAFTNRPFFKNMQPLFATEAADTESDQNSNSSLFLFSDWKPMKTLIQLLAKFSESKTISKIEQEEIQRLFGELDEADKAWFQEHVDEALAFDWTDEESDESEDEGDADESDADEAEDKTDADKGESDKTDEATADAEVPSELADLKANEEWMYQFNESQMQLVKWLISKASAAVAAARKDKITSQVKSLAFNETTKQGLVLPKNVEWMVNFALSLNEKQSEQFFSILKELKSLSFSETGHSKDAKQTVETTAEYKFFTEKMWMTKEEAEEAVKVAKSK